MYEKYLSMLALLVSGLIVSSAVAEQDTSSAETAWRLLDYIAVDYSAAVEHGQIVNDLEYAEMREFSDKVAELLEGLPATKEQSALLRKAETLKNAISQKTPPNEVASLAHNLGDMLLAAYPVTLAPMAPPDIARGKVLYTEQCASCHGATGQGDGPAAKGSEPPPIDFTDRNRARERSVFGLYQVIGQGLDGTTMASFDWLPPEDRWALAFYVGSLSFSPSEVGDGKRVWTTNEELREAFPSLEALTRASEAGLPQRLDGSDATAVLAYLRGHPAAISSSNSGSLIMAKKRLAEGLKAYESDNRRQATDLALSAYLDGFEPVEPTLALRDPALMRQVEEAMISFRSLIRRGAPVEDVKVQVQKISTLLDQAEQVLDADNSTVGASFLGAFTILLREGLEALLIVVAMVAFLNKAERRDGLLFVHAGWLSALIAGALTWVAANSIISISGASRELTEGIGGLLAAIVLVSVGIWMHGKSQAGAWQRYIHQMMSHALSRRSAWFLFLLAFVVVYREVFETILFFIALWNQGNEFAILGGAGSAIVVLAACALVLLKFSRRLPIGEFFFYSSILIAVLAVVLTGKGISALQEAGWFEVSPIAWMPRMEIIGLYPTWQGVTVQVLVLGTLVAAFWFNQRQRPTSSP